MTTNQQHKNIVNPYPEIFTDSNSFESEPLTGGANGLNYDYNSERNKWVLEGIHDCFLNYGYFPRIGKVLRQFGPLNSSNNVVTLADTMAYAAAYPQNGIVESDVIFDVPPDAIEESEQARLNAERDGYPFGLVVRTSDESKTALENMVIHLIGEKTVDKFYSITAPKLQLVENQILFKKLAQQRFSRIGREDQDLYRSMLSSALTVIPGVFNENRTKEIRRSFGNDPETPLLLPKSEQQTQVEIYLNKQPKGLDFTEWSANVPPGDEKKIIYYNPRTRELYYCVRTNSRDPLSFDIVGRQLDQTQKDNVNNFKKEALKAMISFSERFFESEREIEVNLSSVKFDARYGDSFRPSLPSGYGVWLISAAVPLSIITQFSENLKEKKDNSLPLKTSPSPLQISRNLIQNLNPKHRFAHKIKDMEQYVNEMIKVLEYYNEKLYEEGVEFSVLNKLNLEREILKLEQFMPLLFELGATLGLDLTPEDYVELTLSETYEILYLTVNGQTYFQNLGRDLKTLLPPKSNIVVDVVLREDGTPEIEAKNRSEWDSYENIFSNLTPTTIAYLFNSKKISRLSRKLESDDVPPWSDFFITYTYPNPNKNSFKIVNQQQKQKESETVPLTKTKTAQEQSSTLAGTTGEDVKGFKTSKDVQRVLKKRSKTQQQMYMLVRNSTRGCNSGFARATQTLMDGYVAFSKGRPGDIVSFMVHTIRNDVIDLLVATNRTDPKQAGIIRTNIDQATGLSRDPDRIRREIEKYVNEQISGCLDLIGDVVIDTVIDPAVKPSSKGLAGPIKKYWKDAIKPPGSVRIPKSPTSNFFGAWGKKLKELTLKLVEQLILSILGDVISSLLGCGPTLPNTSPTKMNGGRNAVFGVVRFNKIAEQNSINLEEIATSLSMVNLSVALDAEGNKETSESPATLKQLQQLNDDVSDFLTKTEALALLDGNLSPLTMAAIEEMINEGPYSLSSNEVIIESLKTDKQYMAQFQESLKRDDIKYATLGLDVELIRMYFKAIGDKSLNTEDLLDNLDPRDAFCAKYNISDDSPLLDLGISDAQLNAQIDQEVSKKVEKIKDLCDMIAYDGFAWQQDVINFFEQFPVAGMYNNLLSSINKASQEAQKALLEAMKAQQDSTQNGPVTKVESYQETDFYKLCQEKFGDDRIDALPFVQRPNIFQWSVGDINSGKISFFMGGEFTRWFYQDQEEYKLWFSSPLKPLNNPNFRENGGESSYTLRGLSTPNGKQNLGLAEDYPVNSDIATAMINIKEGAESVRSTPSYIQRSYGQNEFVSILDADSSIADMLGVFWVSPVGIRRLQALRETLGKKAFVPGGPKCTNNQSKTIAEAAYFGIEIRVVNFLLNVGPLFRALPGWKTPDTLSVLSYYLTNKIFKEWADRNILNVYVEALNDININYSGGPENDAGNTLEINTTYDQRVQVANLIEQILSTFFTRFGAGRAYTYPGTNIFDPESKWATEGVYQRPVLEDYNSMVHAYRTNEWRYPGGFGVPPFEEQFRNTQGSELSALIPAVPNLETSPGISSEWASKNALYYFPLPLITAMQIIYFDYNVDINAKWPQFRFNTGRQVALADDALLSAVNETTVTIFSNPYNGYPVNIAGNTYYSREEIIAKIISLQEERRRIYELESIFGPLSIFEEDYVSQAYRQTLNGDFLTKDLEEFRDFFNPLYRRVAHAYLERYPTKESRETLRRKVLEQYYVNLYPENFEDGGSEGIQWIRQRAWYERARLLGAAADNATSLLTQYIEGQDTPRLTVPDAGGAPGSRRPMDNAEWEGVKNIRLMTLFANSFDPEANREWNKVLQDDIIDGENNWSESVTEYGVEHWEDGNYVRGAVIVPVGITIQALFDPTVFDETNKIALFNPFYWALVPFRAIFRAADGTDRFRNPNDYDALKWYRNSDSHYLPRGTAAVYFDFQQGLIDAEYKLPRHRGRPNSLSTLDKAAISNMYYELAWRSKEQKKNSDPQNPDSEILLLLDYIDETDQQEYYGTAFPAYIDMEHIKKAYAVAGDDGSPLEAGHLSRQVFLSIEELEIAERNLYNHPIKRAEESYLEKKNAIETLYNEIVSLVDDFEAFANGRENFSPNIAHIRSFINTDGQEDALRQFIDLSIDANLVHFGDEAADWEAHRVEARAELEDELNDEVGYARGFNEFLVASPEYTRTLRLYNEVLSRHDQITTILGQLHQLYADITSDSSANPRTLVGADYDSYGWDNNPLSEDDRARTWTMQEWLDAFNRDINNLAAQIMWRSE